MKLLKITILLAVVFAMDWSSVQAQSLPDQMHFSEDGRRLILGGLPSEGLYDESVVRTIELQFDQLDYWDQMSDNYENGEDILASVVIDGEIYDSVGVRFKGQTSYFMNNSEKKSFNLSLDYMIEDQKAMGYQTLNLNCGFQDPSSIREVLFNYLGRHYNPSLQSNFVSLKINGENWGPYANIQQLNGDYLEEWFLNNDGTRWRAIQEDAGGPPGGGPPGGGPPGGGPPGGGGPGGGGPGGNFGAGESSLNFLGADTSEYVDKYLLKKTFKENPWDDLVNACEKLNNLEGTELYASLGAYIDVDKTLWYLAHEIIWGDEDSYVWKGGMDYYVYWDAATNLVVPLEYDGNSCMLENALEWSPFYNEDNPDFALVNRLFAIPEWRQRYLAHVRSILNTYMVPEDINQHIDGYVALIGDLVEEDPKKIYSYNEFQNEIDFLKDFIRDRRDFLLSHPEIAQESPNIQSTNHYVDGEANVNPKPADEVVVTSQIDASMGIDKVNLYYGTGLMGLFEQIEMFDDGLHNDGAANDGIYGASIPAMPANTYVRYYVKVTADDGVGTVSFDPPGAEHDIYVYKVGLDYVAESTVVINELMASNDTIVTDEAGEYDDWIELYNLTEDTVDLSAYFLTDKPDVPNKWVFPEGTKIAPDDYLIIWADEDQEQGPLHTNFKLSAAGEILTLLSPNLEVIDEVNYGQQLPDSAYARVPNGTGDFEIQAATFGMNNAPELEEPQDTIMSTLGNVLASTTPIEIAPNPATSFVYLTNLSGIPSKVQIFDARGQLYRTLELQDQLRLNTSNWEKGMYFIRSGRFSKRLVVVD